MQDNLFEGTDESLARSNKRSGSGNDVRPVVAVLKMFNHSPISFQNRQVSEMHEALRINI